MSNEVRKDRKTYSKSGVKSGCNMRDLGLCDLAEDYEQEVGK